jgi:aspartate beta-hydroxylase
MSFAGNLQVQQLAYSAQQAMQAGRREEAARLWSQVLAVAPEHPQALFQLAQQRLLQKDTAGGLALLERAAKADPKAPAIPLNIASAHRSAGNGAAELAALDRALAIDPYFLPAMLAKGAALERSGNLKEAAQVYGNALKVAPPQDQTPGELANSLRQARTVVNTNAAQLDHQLNDAFDAVRARYPEARMDRFEAAKEAMLGRRKIYSPQPTMLHFPALPAIEFYDNSDFSWIDRLQAATEEIRAELLALLNTHEADNTEGFRPYVRHPAGVPLNQWRDLNFSPRWSAYFLWEDGKRIDEHCARCPKTAALAESMPLAHIPGYAPAVFFSTLKPHTRIPSHTGVTNIRLIVHLPLIVPEKCFFRVGGDTREVQEGKAWVFDDTMEHEAWNDSDQNRFILIFDIWNPYLSEAERAFVTALLLGVNDYYR